VYNLGRLETPDPNEMVLKDSWIKGTFYSWNLISDGKNRLRYCVLNNRIT